MRFALLLSALLLAGCVASPNGTEPPGNSTVDDAPLEAPPNGTVPASGISERMPMGLEHFVLMPDHTLGVVGPDDAEVPITKVAETLAPTALYQSFTQGLTITPWLGPQSRSAWETTAAIEIVLRFTSDAAATSTNPRAAGIPGVGAWFGTQERSAFFLLASDAPDTLEAGKVYTVRLTATPPQGGFFVLEGEQLALYTFLSYQGADGKPPSYVVGGPDPAGFLLPHEHFNLSAPRSSIVLDEAGEIGPNPGPTADTQQDPVLLSFTVPADALYLRAEVSGAPKAGTRADIDVSILSPSGEWIAGGSSPAASEVVLLGPGNLNAYGRELVARVTGSGTPTGATYALKITAFSPAAS